MTPRALRPVLAILLIVLGCGGAPGRTTTTASAAGDGPAWNAWEAEVFARARREGRPILLSVQAGWCHWCHVMNDTTYRDPAILARLGAGFVLIRAEADARPDLHERYRRYGWPATIFLAPDGRELLALRGFRDATSFATILDEVEAAHREGRAVAPTASEGAPDDAALEALAEALRAQLDGQYDPESAGWGHRQRYPLAAPVEHALYRAAVHGETAWRERAEASLTRYAELIDPVFGGMYQYSEAGVWNRPHFEKIVPVQAGAITSFAAMHQVSGAPRWLDHAEDIARYVQEFLRAEDGAFYTSQDADLGGHGQAGPAMPGGEYYARDAAGRRALGLPRVDRSVYAATNGMLIEAFAKLHVASGRRATLALAVRAMERITRTHRDEATELYAHGDRSVDDDPLFYLADQAYVLRALLALHEATAQVRWLDEARALAAAVRAHLTLEGGGLAAHTEDPRAAGFFAERRVPIEESAVAARAFLRLARLADDDSLRESAILALRAAARADELRGQGRMVGEMLLALEELRAGHVVLSVVGPDDATTAALHAAALRYADPRRLVELGRPGASRYPYPGEPAIFLCSGEACSMPVTDPSALEGAARAFLAD